MIRRVRLIILCGVFLVLSAVAFGIFLNSIYRLPVLMYHSVDYTSDKKDRITIPPEVFAKQMKFLHDSKYNVVPLDKAVSYIAQKKRPPSKTAAITFDDGYENNYKNVFPVVKEYHIPVTIFIITGMIGKDGYLNRKEIKEMSDSGIVDIESHTKTHLWITGLGDKVLEDELEGSKNTLENMLGKKVDYLCYPMGGYDERVKEAVRRAGYKAAFATKPTRLLPVYDLYEIKRVRISPAANNLFVFYIKLTGYHAFFRVVMNDYLDIHSLFPKGKK
ncbi:MAG: polysaccharide deacetylase family protein [Candidatus Omnitrophica bacterium]|nr:polysaccharide deacetylase family protein [Candidatus Omnitrophota bacterium]